MTKRILASLLAIISTSALVPSISQAVNVTITDNCQRTISGSPSSSTSVSTSGDITISGLAGPYAAALGACDTHQINGGPVCTLSASQTMLPVGWTTTLLAKCSLSPTTFTWRGPAGTGTHIAPGSPTSTPSVALTFMSAGSYTYSVAGTSGVLGPYSVPVTILVGDVTGPPTCFASASPASIQAGGASRLHVSCNPPATTSVTWTPEAGAPNVPADGNVTFPSAGTFTYEVVGSNGVSGPVASTTVNVASSGSSSAFTNGGFETPVVAPATILVLPASSGWTGSSSFVTIMTNAAIAGVTAPEGVQFVHARMSHWLEQAVALAPGTYTVKLRARPRETAYPMGIKVIRDNNTANPIANVTVSSATWTEITSAPFTVSAAMTSTFRILVATGDSSKNALVDDVRLVLQ